MGTPPPKGLKLLLVLFLAVGFLRGERAPAAPFVRGDVDGNGALDTSDALNILGHLFLGAPPSLSCGDAADADDSGVLDHSGAVRGSASRSPPASCGRRRGRGAAGA